MDVNNLITQIIFDGKETYIITKDKAVIQRLSLDLKGKPSSDGSMAFDVSFCNLLVITEHKQTKQGLYFQLNLETTKPTEKKPEPIPAKKEPLISRNKPNTATKTPEPKSIHFKPKEAQAVVTRFKKPTEKDLWSED